ncbi:hypothetical protein V9T40_000460 [Parthenolecanium corni]|uniref:Uncharacterized protein n=1 Tax=Parthenolecanium corni TaxID=536013 RepID=A0AAN9TB36_9HEMI
MAYGNLSAYPSFPTWKVYHQIQANACLSTETEIDVQDVCQRCAKETKSDVVYSMCCSNQDEAQTWCLKAIHYGS